MAKDKVIRMDYYGVLKYARALAASEGLQVEYFDPTPGGVNCPHTERNKIHLPRPDPTWNDRKWLQWLDSTGHEIGHNMPENKDGFDTLDRLKLDTQSFYGSALNLIDDHRVDKTRCDKYRGMKDYHLKGQAYHVGKVGEMDWHQITKNHTNKNAKAMQTMLAFDVQARQEWLSSMSGMEYPITNQFDAEQIKWFEKLQKYTDRYLEIETSEQEVEFLDDVLKNVFEIEPEQEKQKAKQPDGKGNGKSQKSGEGQEGQKDQEGKGKSQKDGEGKEDGEGDDDVVDYEQFLNHKPSEDDQKDRGQRKDMHIDYRSYKGSRTYSPHTDETMKIVDFHSGKIPNNFNSMNYRRTSKGDVDRVVHALNIPVLVGETRRLLQVLTRKRNFYNQKKGRLDTSKIYRVCSPDEGLQERIFKTKTESNALDTAVSILVDYSGSMSGLKCHTAIAAAVALEQLCKMMRINCEVSGFSENGPDYNYHYIFKPFGQNVNDDKFIEDMCKGTVCMGSNADGDNILMAYHRLQAQKNKRKVLIILSDGSPASSRGDCYGFTLDVVKGIEARHDVDIIGIGIQDDNVKGIYTNNKVIWKVSDLPKALIQTLEYCILH